MCSRIEDYVKVKSADCFDVSGSSSDLTDSTININFSDRCFAKNADSRDLVNEKDQLPSIYLNQKIFNLLIPALEETLIEASKWNALRVQKCRFNGLDNIAEILWNRNPQRSKIFSPRLNVFDIPPFKEYLRKHPRPYYPKSWLWSEDEAALHIQRYTRGWLIRKRADVQEMRKFWKDISAKSHIPKKTPCIVQPHRTPRKIQEDEEHEVTDEDLHRCTKYRDLAHTDKIILKRVKSMF